MITENSDDTRRGLRVMDIALAVDDLAQTYRHAPAKTKSDGKMIVDYSIISGFFPKHTRESIRQIHTLLACDTRVQDAVNNGMPYTDALRLHKTPEDKIGDLLDTYVKIEKGTAGGMTKKQWQEMVGNINAAANPGETRGRKRKEPSDEKVAAKVATAMEKALTGVKSDAKSGDAGDAGDSTEKAKATKPEKAKETKEGKKPAGTGPGENILASMFSEMIGLAGLADEVAVVATRTAEGKSSVAITFATESAVIVAKALADYNGASPEIKALIKRLELES